MIDKVNNKGFTLVELLAVLVILSAIMGIALPSITSSMERNKDRQNKNKYKMLESFAEIYVTDHKNSIYSKLGDNNTCYIEIEILKESGYLTDDADLDANEKEIFGYIFFDKSNNTYTYADKDKKDLDGNVLTGDSCY